ncbi:hypothetical protein M2105_001528 [Paenibacillus sp. PastF-1]|nr:hypothetical protein [Paenibacillus sp. PastF-2]MDF9847111.1 hypothetical protein [Paenibacillus sp. PastM-2]MDF9853683.1 hypothetical protein [Paenibacillus sp. PastF-1]MDH6478831.1 hypothetical protein [Paenibacillus sp. PastH-2]MDH6506563.1 hypothetical protein [Paenibacillus sp. PastM-3]
MQFLRLADTSEAVGVITQNIWASGRCCLHIL